MHCTPCNERMKDGNNGYTTPSMQQNFTNTWFCPHFFKWPHLFNSESHICCSQNATEAKLYRPTGEMSLPSFAIIIYLLTSVDSLTNQS